MNKWKKEINMVQRYNEVNGTKIDIVIDNFKGEFWFTDEYGNRLTSMEEKKIWEYYGE